MFSERQKSASKLKATLPKLFVYWPLRRGLCRACRNTASANSGLRAGIVESGPGRKMQGTGSLGGNADGQLPNSSASLQGMTRAMRMCPDRSQLCGGLGMVSLPKIRTSEHYFVRGKPSHPRGR